MHTDQKPEMADAGSWFLWGYWSASHDQCST